MFKRGYLLIEVLVTLTILGVFLPILYNVLIKTVKVGSEIKEKMIIQKERLYAFQLFMTDHRECKLIKVINHQSHCFKQNDVIKYSCSKKRLKRQHNSQIMYISDKWVLEHCDIYVRNGGVIFEAKTNGGNLYWK